MKRSRKRPTRAGLITALIGVAIVTLLVLLVIANAWWITSLLSSNPIVVEESVRYIYIAMISEPFMAWGIILGGGLSGAGDTRSVLVRVALGIWLIRIPLAYRPRGDTRVRCSFGLVVHEHLAVCPGLSSVPTVLEEEVACRCSDMSLGLRRIRPWSMYDSMKG